MKALVAATLALGLAFAIGCVSAAFERPVPQRTRFLLSAAPPAVSERAVSGALWVDRVRISPMFSGTGFVYRTTDSVYSSGFLHEFFAPPGDVLREAMIDWLRAASTFASIDRSGESSPEYRLESDVDQLYVDLREPSDPRVVLEGRFRFFDLREGRPVRRFDLRLTQIEPAEDRSGQAVVDAWNRALTRTLEQLDRELREAVVDRESR